MKASRPVWFFVFTFAASAFAEVSISSPTRGTEVTSPFRLSASAATCSAQPVRSMTYSLDSGGSDLANVTATFLEDSVSAGAGTHTVHVKALGDDGAFCVTDVSVTVISSSGRSAEGPAGATTVSDIQTFAKWKGVHDTGTPGTSIGSTSLVTSPSLSGSARQFVTNFTGHGGERYSISFADDTSASNFIYDNWVYIAGSTSSIANIEMDINQVIANGLTAMLCFQCDGYSNTWDYTLNKGTPERPSSHWVHTPASCNPRSWTANTWHHVQISYSHDDNGVATYNYVTFDGVKSPLNITGLAAKKLGWAPSISSNFQVDGFGPVGRNTIYIDNFTLTYW